jgi:hypothetical protein
MTDRTPGRRGPGVREFSRPMGRRRWRYRQGMFGVSAGGGRSWDRTSDPLLVREVLYR